MHMEEIPNYSDEEEEQKILSKQLEQGCRLTGSTGWDQLSLRSELRKVLREIGFQKPSHVQVEALPHALAGKNLLCQAKSGSGKTAVFILTILQNLSKINGQYQPFSSLVIVHTRQLAHQIFTQFQKMKKYIQDPAVGTACFFGAISIEENIHQIENKQNPISIIIGTPGRLSELVYQGHLDISKIKCLVIDQCDNILKNKSMRADLAYMVKKTPVDKQTLMFSATISQDDKKDARNFMEDFAQIYVNEGTLNMHGLTQYYRLVEENKKLQLLFQMLDQIPFNQTIIFLNKVSRVKNLAKLMEKKMFNPFSMHSKLSQEQRIKTYDEFKGNKRKILVATDLFGRGIDIKRVNLVINFDFPYDKETYLHRVGRTGRFNTKGTVINFINPNPDNYPYERQQKQEQVLAEVQKCFDVKISQFHSTMRYPLSE